MTLHYITVHYITVQYLTVQYTTVHYTTLYYTTEHCRTLHDIALRYMNTRTHVESYDNISCHAISRRIMSEKSHHVMCVYTHACIGTSLCACACRCLSFETTTAYMCVYTSTDNASRDPALAAWAAFTGAPRHMKSTLGSWVRGGASTHRVQIQGSFW